MPELKATLSLKEGKASIHVSPGSELLRGADRVFFVNILGFALTEESPGYSKEVSADVPRLLKEVVSYLKDRDVEISFDSAAQSIAEELRKSEGDLATSRTQGIKLKKHPVKSIQVPTFNRVLKPYQIPAVAHLVNVHNAANFSVPGSGKTTIVLAAYAILKAQGKVDRLVVIGPRAAFMPWEDEFEACFGTRPNTVRIVGPREERDRRLQAAHDADLVLLSYNMASNESDRLARILRDHKTMLVLDESHNIKRLEGGTWADNIVALAPHATRRAILSGTPVPNSLTDIWSQITFLWPTDPVLGPRHHFRYRARAGGDETANEVRDQLYPFYWRIKKADLKLPKPTFKRISIPMGKYQDAIYSALAARVLSETVHAPEERTKLRLWRKARMVRLLQAASNPTLLHEYSSEFKVPPLDPAGLPVDRLIENYSSFETPPKIEAAAKLARQIVSRGRKVLIWSVFIHNIRTLERLLADLDPVTIYGEIPKDENEDKLYNRELEIGRFKSPTGPKVMIANPAACAESVSLHKACHDAIYLDRTFNAAHYMQSLDRIHRVGLEPGTKVRYYFLISEGSLDVAIDERLTEKQRKMLRLLDEEFRVVDLDSAWGEFSEENEEDKDFQELLQSLRAKVRASTHD